MDDNDYVLAFDHFYTTNHIQILKSLIPFMEGEQVGMLPAIVKYMELQYTLSLIEKGSKPTGNVGIHACSKGQDDKDTKGIEDNIEQIYNAVHRYLAPNEEKLFSQLMSAMRTMKNMREMQQMMELFQNLNPDLGGGMDIGSMMENLNPGSENTGGINLNEIMEMMKLFGGNDNGKQ